MNEYINPTGDVPHDQCSICGWWVSKHKHTWIECMSLINLSGKTHIFDEPQRQPIPATFYKAFNWETPDGQ